MRSLGSRSRTLVAAAVLAVLAVALATGAAAAPAVAAGSLPPPVIAPYAAVAGPDGVPSALHGTDTPTPPSAAVTAGSGGHGRAVGLLAAVTSVLLAGLVAAHLRLLLARAGATNRRR